MSIANTIADYLIDCHVDYHVYPHPYTENTRDAALAAQVEAARVAKAVVFATVGDVRRQYRLAVLPATRDIDVLKLCGLTSHRMELAREHELTILFPDCEVGAVPPLGGAYGLQTFVDESIKARPGDVFFEAGDHEELIGVSATQFRRLMAGARCASFSFSGGNITH